MIFAREPAISLFDLLRLSITLDTQNVVVVLFGHRYISDCRLPIADLKGGEKYVTLRLFSIGNWKLQIGNSLLVFVYVDVFSVDHIIFARAPCS